MLSEKNWSRPGEGNATANPEHKRSYPSVRTVQRRANALARDWFDVAVRFLSGFWHDPIAGYNAAVDAGLGPEHFPSEQTWNLARALAGHVDVQLTPTIASVLRVIRANNWELPGGGGDECAELTAVIWAESSGACVRTYAALLHDFGERRRLARVLQQAYRDLLDSRTPVAHVAADLLSTFRSWRKGVRHAA